jgi:hypothetical protein
VVGLLDSSFQLGASHPRHSRMLVSGDCDGFDVQKPPEHGEDSDQQNARASNARSYSDPRRNALTSRNQEDEPCAETREQLDAPNTLGVEQAQGYALARPTTDRQVGAHWAQRTWHTYLPCARPPSLAERPESSSVRVVSAGPSRRRIRACRVREAGLGRSPSSRG